MAKIRQSPKLPADERRRQLMESALSLFSQKSYQETSMEEIARNAQLTKGALYFHFKNKEDILYEGVKLVISDFFDVFHRLPARKATPGEFVRAVLKQKEEGCHGRLHLTHHLDLWQAALGVPKIHRVISKAFVDFREKFVEVIDQRYGRSPRERRHLANVTFSFLDGLMFREIVAPKLIDRKRQSQFFVKMIEAYSNHSKKTS